MTAQLPNSVNQSLPYPQPGGQDAHSLFQTFVGWAGNLVQQLNPFGTAINQLLALFPGGLLGVANGGTGDSTLTAHSVLVGEGTSAVVGVSPGVAGTVLTSNGPSADPSFQAQVIRSYLAGLTLSNDSVAPNTKMDVTAGVCADDTNSVMLSMAAGAIDCTTTGANGLDTGTLAASTSYHFYAIAQAGGSPTAFLASTSATSPTLPTGYTLKRRIASIKTDASAHLFQISQNGDEFLLKTSIQDLNNVASSSTAALFTLSVPTGIVVNALMRFEIASSNQNSAVVVTSPSENDQAITGGFVSIIYPTTSAGGGISSHLNIRTNSVAQVRIRGNAAAGSWFECTYGWIDRRGRDS